jgi:hypothetical protein
MELQALALGQRQLIALVIGIETGRLETDGMSFASRRLTTPLVDTRVTS